MRLGVFFFCFLVSFVSSDMRAAEYFVPSQRVSGIGASRDDISPEVLKARTEMMIQSQTFGIMREPKAMEGARRILTPRLQSLFQQAERQSGVPASLIEAIAYLESWGDANAESPAGPKGIMQISGATARTMGLKVVTATRYKITKEKVLVLQKAKGRKPYWKTVTKKTPYTVIVRDDRLVPERAVPAAAMYFAGMERRFGSTDWALFAYHCGQGCVSEMMELTRRARGIPRNEISVARMFFSASPAWNRELYQAVQQQMQRDYSPTYYFRVMRAQQLLALYRRSPVEFAELAQQFRSDINGGSNASRAPHRLSVWLKRDDLQFMTCDQIRAASGKSLAKALNDPEHLGYSLNVSSSNPADLEYFQHASPSAIGTLTYIAYETRRLYDEMKPMGEKFKPIPVVSLVAPQDYITKLNQREGLSHCSGHVFDIDYSSLPVKEVEALRFVLNDLGWSGYLGFIDEGRDGMHIGCSPSSREFFSGVYQEAVGVRAKKTDPSQATLN